MMKLRTCLILLVTGLFAGPVMGQSSLTTTFANNNGNIIGGGNFFDVNVLNPNGIVVTGFSVNAGVAVSSPLTLNVWTRSGTATGFQQSFAGWTQVSTGVGVAAGIGVPSFIDVADFALAPGVTGFALHNQDYDARYTNGTGGNQFFSNADLSLTLGSATNGFLVPGIVNSPRVWNGTVFYTVAVPEPTTLGLLGLALCSGGYGCWRARQQRKNVAAAVEDYRTT